MGCASDLDSVALSRLPARWLTSLVITENAHRPELGPCWTKLGWNSGNGYAKVWAEGCAWMAHIFVFRLAGGVCPPGLLHDHLCRNRACVRPSHVEPVTPRENTLRGNAKLFRRLTRDHVHS